MKKIIEDATNDRYDAKRRAIGHEFAANHHRRRGVQFGIAATVVSSIVGSAIVAKISTTLTEVGGGTILAHPEGWTRLAYVAVGLLSILAPVLTGLQAFLRHPEQTAKHTSSSAEYDRLSKRLAAFIDRYGGRELSETEGENGLKEWQEISNDKERILKDAIALTPRALQKADTELTKPRMPVQPGT
jgi:hypothetical protein